MLFLAVHTIDTPSARVPFNMIICLDKVTRRDLPEDIRCRMLLPTSGNTSVSLWDVSSSKEVLEDWLQASVGAFCSTQVLEVVEDHAYGVSLELTRARTAERVTQVAKENATRVASKVTTTVGSKLATIEDKYKVTEKLDYAVNTAATKAGQATATASQVVEKIATRAMENRTIAQGVTSLSQVASRGYDFLSRQLGLVSAAASQYNEQESIRAVQPEDIRGAIPIPSMPQVHLPQVHLPQVHLPTWRSEKKEEVPPPAPQPEEPNWLGFDGEAASASAPPQPEPSAPPAPQEESPAAEQAEEVEAAVEEEEEGESAAAAPEAAGGPSTSAAVGAEEEEEEEAGLESLSLEDNREEEGLAFEEEGEGEPEGESDFLKEIAAIDEDFKQ